LRLKPHTWSASWTSLAVKDREAALRVCPTTDLAGDHAGQFNIEFRAADGTANPYVALAAIVRAGISGLKRALPAPPLVEGDPARMSEDERRRLGLRRLPDTLVEAIAAFERDDEARDWFPVLFNDSFLGVRRAELAQTKGYDPEAMCALYKTLY
jgi:glutamine synthetase